MRSALQGCFYLIVVCLWIHLTFRVNYLTQAVAEVHEYQFSRKQVGDEILATVRQIHAAQCP